CMQYTHMPLTF
nr:immunoglobulin light chain junction region [Macaca mulatta]MOV81676.1 immunoglobulin light chain junction region [Macaca mulatta]MOV82151.1 immunoglobulin light chain junction region [Macaca mulatta]MOV82328.1 immunoglobulin light chain junction region [Macaca mulatta]MOV83906.1 immunoglobulin light chain junction region [Macaca mulatta]